MKVNSLGIVDGVIADRYGKRGDLDEYGVSTCSLPLSFTDVPNGTKTISVVIEDKDAIPISGGFSWIHWVVANIKSTSIPENASRSNPDFVQGLNSYISVQGGSLPKEACAFYAGMAPPDAPHYYEIHAYALSCELALSDGFYMNEMYHKMFDHILASNTIRGLYAN